MSSQIALFVAITLVVGLVNLILAQPLERPVHKELLSYVGVVIGGISLFTAGIVAISVFLQ